MWSEGDGYTVDLIMKYPYFFVSVLFGSLIPTFCSIFVSFFFISFSYYAIQIVSM